MRKILSFLALLVVGFALPWQAMAWTIYFDNSSTNWSTVKCYVYNSDSDRLSEWQDSPAMTSIGGNIYSYTSNGKTYGKVIFQNGSGSQVGDFNFSDGHIYNNVGDKGTYASYVWDFDNNTKPKAVKLTFNNNAGGAHELSYDGSKDYKWSCTFSLTRTTDDNSYTKFYLTLTNQSGATQNVCHDAGQTSVNEVWTKESKIEDGNKAYYQSGLTANKQYRFELKGDGPNAFQWRIVEVPVVKAWDFNGAEKPSELKVVFTSMFSGDAATKELNHQGGTNGWMTNTKFEAPADGTFSFYLYAKNDEGTWENIRGSQDETQSETSFDESAWVSVDAFTTDGSNTFSQGGIVKGATYKLAVKGNGDNKFQWNFTKIDDPQPVVTVPDALYIYEKSGKSPEWSNQIGSASYNAAAGTFTFSNVPVTTANMEITVSSVASSTGWASIKDNMYSADADGSNTQKYPTVAANGSTAFEAGVGTWKLSDTGTYDIVIDWNAGTITFNKQADPVEHPDALYLQMYDNSGFVGTGQFRESWSSSWSGNTVTYKVSGSSLTAGYKLLLSTESSYKSGTLYGPTADITLPCSGSSFTGFEDKSGSRHFWTIDEAADYIITVDWAAMTFTATKDNGGVVNPPVGDDVDPIYMFRGNGGTNWSNQGQQTEYKDGWYYYTIKDWTKGRYLVFSTNSDEQATWWQMGADSGSKCTLYGCAESNDTNIGGSSDPTTSALSASGRKAWKLNVDNSSYTMVVRINPTTGQLVIDSLNVEVERPKLYMYTSSNDWGKWKYVATETSNGSYTFNVTLAKDEAFAFMTEGKDKIVWGSAYRPGDDTNIGGANDKTETAFQNSGDGTWKASQAGTYKIRILKGSGKVRVLSSPAKPVSVRLPLTASDFADGKKHYFLVGDRLGEWKLQPEWELADNGNGTYVLKNRFIYETDFAVAVVDNYEDYAVHCYTWYSSNTDMSDSRNETDAFGSHDVNERYAGKTGYKGSNKFHAKWDTANDAYWQGAGAFMSEIELTVNALGTAPTKIKFTRDQDNAGAYRMFTLVGEGFYNNRYKSGTYDGENSNTATYRSNLTGSTGSAETAWQDAWIQYNPNTQRPYVDANNEYLYHTSFTPDYLIKNPVLFNRTLSDGQGQFPFSSSSIQFVDADQLDTEDDPYRDFYKSIADKYTIDNSGTNRNGGYNASENGDGVDTRFNYNVKTKFNNVNVTRDGNTYNYTGQSFTQTPTGKWHCLVVKDMWVEGEFKFWSGWGGSVRNTNGNDGNGATWNAPNGGPDIPQWKVNDALKTIYYEVDGYDVTEGRDATLYKSVRNRDEVNYRTKNGEMQYYNRVILWYNEEGEVGQSFMQFIQENAGPAIFAQNYSEGGKDNFLKYTWYVQKPDNEAEAITQGNTKVIGYTIHRYQRTEDGNIDLGYAEGSASEMKPVPTDRESYYVRDFYRGSSTRPDWVQNVPDYGQGKRGFDPGVYFYTITLYYEKDGGSYSKKATSNEVPIYADELVTPEAVAYQIIEFTDTDAPKAALGTTGQKYMTYSPVAGTPIYAFNIVSEKVEVKKDGKTETVDVEIPANVKALTRATAINYLRNNPDKTLWTSDFYVRCLDEDDYYDALQAYKDNGILLDEVLPTPTVKLSQLALDAEEGADYIEKGYAGPFHLNNNNYYSAIMRRGGNLTDVAIKVDLSFDYTEFKLDAEGNPSSEKKTASSDASSEIYPVMPQPYGAKYRYNVTRPERNLAHPKVEEGYKYGQISVPVENESGVSYNSLKENKEDVYVRFDANFDPRSLDLEVDFNRPNVKDDIYKWYDIQYEVNIDNNEEKVPLDVTATLHDTKYETGDYGKRYRMEIHGLHPLNGVYPTVKFVKTNYVARELTDDEMATRPEGYFESKEATFGNEVKVDAKQNVEINTAEISGLHLGYIENADNPGTYDWMYKGHTSLNDTPEMLTASGASNEDQSDVTIKPMYYLYQVKHPNTGSVLNTYEFLVPHIDDHNSGKPNTHPDNNVGIDLNDKDPLIGAYLAKGIDTGMDGNKPKTPDVYITAIYVFERPVAGMSKVVEGMNDLEVVDFYFNGTDASQAKVNLKNGPARARDEFSAGDSWTSDDYDKFIAGAYAELPSTNRAADGSIQLPANAVGMLDMNEVDKALTGYNKYYAVRGATVKVTDGDFVVTGVDDILSDSAYDGEAVYYNLQGIRIENPSTPGVYIKVEGKKTTKVVID